MYRALADLTVVAHVIFVLFVLFGGLLVIWRAAWVWIHVPAAIWGVWVELAGWVCPLTPLENWLRERGGEAVYASSFVERYLMPTLYPSSLTRETQWLLGGLVLLINAVVYAIVFRRHGRRMRSRTRLQRSRH
jgi:hypothetical protein